MAAFKCYIIIRRLTYSMVLKSRLRNVTLATIWIVAILTLVVATAGGMRWGLDSKGKLLVPEGNPKSVTGLRYF